MFQYGLTFFLRLWLESTRQLNLFVLNKMHLKGSFGGVFGIFSRIDKLVASVAPSLVDSVSFCLVKHFLELFVFLGNYPPKSEVRG